MKNLIMGVVQNYSWIEIEPFVVSWKKSFDNTDLVLFCDNISDSTVQHLLKINDEPTRGGY